MTVWYRRTGPWLSGIFLTLATPAIAAATGTDEQAAGLASALTPGYRPWFSPLFAAPGERAQMWFFALQALLGLGVLLCCLVALRRRARIAGEARRAD